MVQKGMETGRSGSVTMVIQNETLPDVVGRLTTRRIDPEGGGSSSIVPVGNTIPTLIAGRSKAPPRTLSCMGLWVVDESPSSAGVGKTPLMHFTALPASQPASQTDRQIDRQIDRKTDRPVS